MGFVVGKRVGKAVRRNRVKRRLRAAARELLAGALGQADVVVIAKPGAADIGYWQLYDQLAQLLSRARLINSDGGSGLPCPHER
jgi:ribonuclease P protein component